jgi:soluble lytic murein transglycosylase-like protein
MGLGLWLVLLSAAGAAQDPHAAMETSIARQRAALETQREAVRLQVKAGPQPAASPFFTVPWSTPVAPPVTVAAAAECDPVPEEEIAPIVREISEREGITPDLLRAVIEKESSYLPCAVSRAGAQGLMQLMPDTASGLGVENSFDPRQNVDGGARFLKQLIDRYGGNLVLALAAYNAGPRRADSASIFPLPLETTNYVSDILGKLGSASVEK